MNRPGPAQLVESLRDSFEPYSPDKLINSVHRVRSTEGFVIITIVKVQRLKIISYRKRNIKVPKTQRTLPYVRHPDHSTTRINQSPRCDVAPPSLSYRSYPNRVKFFTSFILVEYFAYTQLWHGNATNHHLSSNIQGVNSSFPFRAAS